MTLNFPNQSRSFDSTRRAVRFWGYDTAMEASFFITEDALKQVQPDMRFDEAGLLNAFDTNRETAGLRLPSKRACRGRLDCGAVNATTSEWAHSLVGSLFQGIRSRSKTARNRAFRAHPSCTSRI
jgi:Protein of unknown function (DUF1488)